MIDQFSSSVLNLALLKLFTLTFSARDLVSMDFRIHEPVMNVRFLQAILDLRNFVKNFHHLFSWLCLLIQKSGYVQ